MTGITAQNLHMQFDDFMAVNDISFDVKQGEFITLLGPSGCGKTTLLKMISGFLTPTQGQIILGGKNVTLTPPEKRDTALCFQSYALFPHMTVLQNLEFGLRQQRISTNDRQQRINIVTEQLELGSQLTKLPNQLSGGQQQRVALGRALVMQPSVILFDEPLSNLDAKLRDQVRLEIHRIQRDNNLTAIYVTHDQSEALALSDRVFVMNKGKVEQTATPEQLYHQPRTSFVADFIGNANIVDAQLIGGDAQSGWQLKTSMGNLTSHTNIAPTSKNIQLCWRPEKAKINGNSEMKFSAKVKNKIFQGHFISLTVDIKDQTYRIQLPETNVQIGETIQFSLDAKDIILLEANT